MPFYHHCRPNVAISAQTIMHNWHIPDNMGSSKSPTVAETQRISFLLGVRDSQQNLQVQLESATSLVPEAESGPPLTQEVIFRLPSRTSNASISREGVITGSQCCVHAPVHAKPSCMLWRSGVKHKNWEPCKNLVFYKRDLAQLLQSGSTGRNQVKQMRVKSDVRDPSPKLCPIWGNRATPTLSQSRGKVGKVHNGASHEVPQSSETGA